MNRDILDSFSAFRNARQRGVYAGASLQRQKGMTSLGLIILITFIGLFAFATLRLAPIYLNYLKVAGVVNGVYAEFDSQTPSRSAIRLSIRRRFDVESVDVVTARDVKVNSVDGGFEVVIAYDHTAPFISNVYFTVKFDKRATVRR